MYYFIAIINTTCRSHPHTLLLLLVLLVLVLLPPIYTIFVYYNVVVYNYITKKYKKYSVLLWNNLSILKREIVYYVLVVTCANRWVYHITWRKSKLTSARFYLINWVKYLHSSLPLFVFWFDLMWQNSHLSRIIIDWFWCFRLAFYIWFFALTCLLFAIFSEWWSSAVSLNVSSSTAVP